MNLVKMTIGRRWYRVAIFCGSAPGSHMGFWRTRNAFGGRLQGWNYRVGTLSRCVTVFFHTRRVD